MKQILVPIDYSGNSKNATDYALEFARRTGMKILFLHAYHVPVPDTHGKLPPPDNLGTGEINKLKNYTAAYRSKNPDIGMDFLVQPGFAVDSVLSNAETIKPDLMIMGTGAKSSIGDYLMGSVVTKVISRSSVPILVIPENVRFKEIKKIALAYDYSELNNLNVLGFLKVITDIFKSEILVLNVLPNEKALLKKTGSSNLLEGFLAKKIPHSFHFPINKNVVKGLNDFIEAEKVQLSALITHKDKKFRLFHKSSVKQIVLHPHIPLLVLPG